MISLQDEERLIEAFGTHWVKYTLPILISSTFSIACIAFIIVTILTAPTSLLTGFISTLIPLIILLGVLHWFFHKLMSESMDDIIITNRRLIYFDNTLLLYDTMHEVQLTHIRGVEATKRGIFQNLLNYGTLWFDTGGSSVSGARTIPLVPHPQRKAKTIMHLLEMK